MKTKTICEQEGSDQAKNKDAEEVSQKAWSKYESGDSDRPQLSMNGKVARRQG